MTPQEIFDTINSPKSSGKEFYTLEKFLDDNKWDEAILYIQNIFNCDENVARETLSVYKEQAYDVVKKAIADAVASLSPEQIAHNNAVAREWQNKPKCPTCSSTNVQKISSFSKAGSVAVFGIFSQKVRHQFRCNNCGYEW